MSIIENDSATIESLINAVTAADSASLLVTAMENLAATQQPAAIPTLIAALSYNNPGAAVAAVDGLVQIGEPAVEPILAQLDGHNYTARAWAIRALAGIGDPRGLVTLLGAATADFALSVRRAAAKGLGSMKWHWFPADLLEIAQSTLHLAGSQITKILKLLLEQFLTSRPETNATSYYPNLWRLLGAH